MKLTKFRLLKQLDKPKSDKQTRRRFKKDIKRQDINLNKVFGLKKFI